MICHQSHDGIPSALRPVNTYGGDSADLGRKTAAVFILRERHPVSRNALSIIALPKAMATNQMGLLDISG